VPAHFSKRHSTFAIKCGNPPLIDSEQRLYGVIDVVINGLLLLLRELEDCRYAATASKLLATKRAAFSKAKKLMQLAFITATVVASVWHENSRSKA